MFTGVRPGERMHEILFARERADRGHRHSPASSPRAQRSRRMETMRGWLAMLEQGLAREEREAIYRVLRDAVPDFHSAVA